MTEQEKSRADVRRIMDFEASMLIIERDVAQFKANRIDELLNEYGQAKGLAEADKKTVSYVLEETFTILKFETSKGERLGEYEVAHKSSNLPDKWSHAYNILRQNNAVINSRYSGPTYHFSYWLYSENKIYRQRLKAQG